MFAAVGPALVPLSSGFGRVEGSQNLVTVRGIFGGETSFSGSGAGGSPTAVAVVSDVLSIRRASRREGGACDAAGRAGPHRSAATSSRRTTCASPSSTSPASSPQVGAAYARYGINIEGVLQLPKFRKDRLPFVTTLEECPESVLDRALAEVATLDYHVEPPLSLPICHSPDRRTEAL